MALVDVKGPLPTNDSASGGTAADQATLKYTVLYDSGTETAVDAINETGVPVPGDAHPSLANLTANRRTAQRRGLSFLFDVIIQYGTIDITIGGSGAVDPTSRDTQWSERGRPSQVEVDTEADGTVLRNTANDVVRQTIPYSDINLIAVKNYAARQDFTAFFNKVNSAVFEGYAVKRVFLPHVDQAYTEEFFDGETVIYWQATFPFQILIPRTATDPSTWEYRIVNQGMKKKITVGANTFQVPIVDPKTGTQTANQTLLDAAGDVLAIGAAPLFLNGGATAAVAGKVDMYQTADFTTIGL